MSGGDGEERILDQTPSWAVAGVCAVIIMVSIALETSIQKVGNWLTERHKRAIYEALEKIKSELMTLGFISLILVFCQYYIANICLPISIANTMLPCAARTKGETKEKEHHHRLLWYERRFLAVPRDISCKEGHVSLISVEGLHQIHILIFFLAAIHVFYSAITMFLGRLKIRGWKEWEKETLTHDYEFSNDRSRIRLTHETSFVRGHNNFWSRIPLLFYIGCFLQQFFKSVSKSDYLTLRNGFITVHLSPGTKFNFQKYIKRSLEDDFKTVVGVSPVLWASFVVFLFLNVHGWHSLFWASLIPLLIILAIGMKLQAILTRMALEIVDRNAVLQGMPLVQGSDKYFWFSRPRFLLHLIHFALFQNAFQITYFLWIWYEYGLHSCFHDNFSLVIAKMCLGFGVLFLCSYITLPLYALVTQMGSNMKKSIFDEQTSKALKKWHMAVKKKRGAKSPAHTLGSVSRSSSMGSTYHQMRPDLHRYKTIGHSGRSPGPDESDFSDLEDQSAATLENSGLLMETATHATQSDDPHRADSENLVAEGITVDEKEFSFVKLVKPDS